MVRMAFTTAFVFLLIHLVAGAMAQEPAAKPKSTEEQPKSAMANLNPVIMDLAKQAVALENLRKEISALEKEDGAFKERIWKMEMRENALKAEQTKREAAHLSKERELQAQVMALRQQATAQASTAMELKNKVSKLENQDSGLRQQVTNLETKTDDLAKKASIVSAFHAGISGNINKNHKGTIVFNKVLYMHGRGYNSNTGKFTAPAHGLYAFQATVGTHCAKCEGTSSLYVNGHERGLVFTAKHNYGGQASTSFVAELKTNDVVHVAYTWGYSELRAFPFTSFSGYLVKAF